jgi:hypothetical protein
MESAGKAFLNKASTLEIASDGALQGAGDILLAMKREQKAIETELAEPIKKAHELHKWLTGVREKVLAPYRQGEMLIKQKMGRYQSAIEDARRREYEAKVKAEQERIAAERIKEAEQAMDKGDLKSCEQILAAPPPAVVDVKVDIPEATKVTGVSFREEWDFQIIDEALIPRQYLAVNEVAIRKVVKALGKEAAIPGVAIFKKTVVTGRAA